LNINQLSLATLPSRALSHGTLPIKSLKRPKSALLKSRVVRMHSLLLCQPALVSIAVLWLHPAFPVLHTHTGKLGFKCFFQEKLKGYWSTTEVFLASVIKVMYAANSFLTECQLPICKSRK